MSSRRICETSSRRFQDVFKMSSRCFAINVFLKTSWRRFGNKSWRCLAKTFSRSLQENVLKMFWQDVFKTSWERLEDVWARRIYWSWPKRLEDVLKTSSEDVWLIRIYLSSSRCLQDVLKTSFEDEVEWRLQDVFIKTNFCWMIQNPLSAWLGIRTQTR